VLSRLGNQYTRMVLGRDISDYTTGLRRFARRAAEYVRRTPPVRVQLALKHAFRRKVCASPRCPSRLRRRRGDSRDAWRHHPTLASVGDPPPRTGALRIEAREPVLRPGVLATQVGKHIDDQ
jgi:hypothetical protein